MGKGSNYLEAKMLSTLRGPQIWVPVISHVFMLGLKQANRSLVLSDKTIFFYKVRQNSEKLLKQVN